MRQMSKKKNGGCMKNTELVIMATGMGRLFGGLKHIEPISPGGEMIIDFSIYDAVKADLTKLLLL